VSPFLAFQQNLHYITSGDQLPSFVSEGSGYDVPSTLIIQWNKEIVKKQQLYGVSSSLIPIVFGGSSFQIDDESANNLITEDGNNIFS